MITVKVEIGGAAAQIELEVNVVLFTFPCSRWWYYSSMEECSDHGESRDCSDA